MVSRITIVVLMISAFGCAQETKQAPQQEPARPNGSPMILISDVYGGVLKSTDPLPSFCQIGNKDCLKPNDKGMRPCKIGSDDCPMDGMIRDASVRPAWRARRSHPL